MNGSDSVEVTIQTYNQMVPTYFSRWRSARQAVVKQLEFFMQQLPAGGIVLDVGCGPGFDSDLLSRRGFRVVSIDYSLGMLQQCRQYQLDQLVQADMRWLPFAGPVDGLWVSASLLHIPRPAVPLVLAEFRRLLASDGCLYLSLKEGEGVEVKTEGAASTELEAVDLNRHFVLWQADELNDQLAESGFEVIKGWTEIAPTGTNWLVRFCSQAPD